MEEVGEGPYSSSSLWMFSGRAKRVYCKRETQRALCPQTYAYTYIYDRHFGPTGGPMLRTNVKPTRLHLSRTGIRRELFFTFLVQQYSLNSYSFSKSQSDYSSNGSYQRFISRQTGRTVTPSKRTQEETTRSGNRGTEGIETGEAKSAR